MIIDRAAEHGNRHQRTLMHYAKYTINTTHHEVSRIYYANFSQSVLSSRAFFQMKFIISSISRRMGIRILLFETLSIIVFVTRPISSATQASAIYSRPTRQRVFIYYYYSRGRISERNRAARFSFSRSSTAITRDHRMSQCHDGRRAKSRSQYYAVIVHTS